MTISLLTNSLSDRAHSHTVKPLDMRLLFLPHRCFARFSVVVEIPASSALCLTTLWFTGPFASISSRKSIARFISLPDSRLSLTPAGSISFTAASSCAYCMKSGRPSRSNSTPILPLAGARLFFTDSRYRMLPVRSSLKRDRAMFFRLDAPSPASMSADP